jgi:signal transduction histidine kinase
MSLSTLMTNENETRVLVVDDNAADRNLVRLSLEKSPKLYRLECAGRLSEGLEKLGVQRPDVVLLDLNLPDSMGCQTVQKVAHEVPEVPILVLTGSDDESLALEAVRLGAQDYIVKGQIESHALTRAMGHAIERHQVLAALRESRQRQLEFKDKFLSHVSHELRSPLASIHQFAEVMLDGLAGPLTDKEREYLQSVLRNAGQLKNLIDDLLDAASANVGKLTVEFARVDPSEVLKQGLQMLGQKANARGLGLRVKAGDSIPPVQADRRRLLQVCVNLIENAIKFTSAGGEIWLQAKTFADDPKFVQFSVTDTGKGIEPENLRRIFDRLYQEQNAVLNRQGLGLGLAISEEIVKRHGGRIWVESTPGKGSTFYFIIPVFSLADAVSPILVRDGKVQEATLVAIEIAPGSRAVSDEVWELTQRQSRDIIERCILPDKDLLLPAMLTLECRELIFVLACTDPSGGSVLEKRIVGQLTAAPQIVNSCLYKTACIPLPAIPPDKSDLAGQLEWFSGKIEDAILQASRS